MGIIFRTGIFGPKKCNFRGKVVPVTGKVKDFFRILEEEQWKQPVGLRVRMKDFTNQTRVPAFLLPKTNFTADGSGLFDHVCAQCGTELPPTFIVGMAYRDNELKLSRSKEQAEVKAGQAGRCPKCGNTNVVVVFAPMTCPH